MAILVNGSLRVVNGTGTNGGAYSRIGYRQQETGSLLECGA